MFSQLRNAVESLAQQQQQSPPPRRPGRSTTGSQDISSESAERVRSSGSLDIQSAGRSLGLSTNQLAESALSNLRRSFVTQRAGSPSPSLEKSPTPTDRELRQIPKFTLEDRLRATFAIGDASATTTPEAPSSSTSSPGTPALVRDAVSPLSVPLPQSPMRSPEREREMPTLSSLNEPLQSSESQLTIEIQSPVGTSIKDSITRDPQPATVDEVRYHEADISLPCLSPELTSPHNTLGLPEDDVLVVKTVEEIPSPNDETGSSINDISAAGSIAAHPSTSDDPDVPVRDVLATGMTTEDDVETLRDRLKLLEQRFTDVSNSFKQLQANKEAVDKVIRELTPVESVTDGEGLREHLQSLIAKDEISQDEIKRLNGKLRNYDDRIEELRDTHRLESHSQSAQVEGLRKQMEEAEALLKSAHDSTARVEEESNKRQTEIGRLQAEVQKSKGLAKEEEEKRTKAISLLKTVRQKLVKAEKDRDDAIRENGALKEKDKADREREKVERGKLETEIETVRAEKEKDIAGLKSHFDRELTNMKDRLEKEHAARKGQFELDAITTKAAHQKEVELRNSRISSLENSVRSLNSEKDNIFDQLQMRQAELESSQSHLESLQSSTTELQFQLREATERIGALMEELVDARNEQDYRGLRPSASSEESSRMLSAAEAKYEAKLTELNSKITAIEKERNETEATLNRNLRQKMQEADTLRRVVDSSARTKEDAEHSIAQLKQETERLSQEIIIYQKQAHASEQHSERVVELEAMLRKQAEESASLTEEFGQQIRDVKGRESQLRASNKALREELRKVQSSAALLERQRNPGVGYWSTASRPDNTSDIRMSTSSSSDSRSAVNSPRTSSPAPATDDEEVNLEYLRNVILQFLEHKEMRPHLVKVLSIILHFTPQETRRLVAKV